MKRIKHSEAQIIAILKEQEQGKKVSEICRAHNISEPTFYSTPHFFATMQKHDFLPCKIIP